MLKGSNGNLRPLMQKRETMALPRGKLDVEDENVINKGGKLWSRNSNLIDTLY